MSGVNGTEVVGVFPSLILSFVKVKANCPFPLLGLEVQSPNLCIQSLRKFFPPLRAGGFFSSCKRLRGSRCIPYFLENRTLIRLLGRTRRREKGNLRFQSAFEVGVTSLLTLIFKL